MYSIMGFSYVSLFFSVASVANLNLGSSAFLPPGSGMIFSGAHFLDPYHISKFNFVLPLYVEIHPLMNVEKEGKLYVVRKLLKWPNPA
jgi:hypothetical protein